MESVLVLDTFVSLCDKAYLIWIWNQELSVLQFRSQFLLFTGLTKAQLRFLYLHFTINMSMNLITTLMKKPLSIRRAFIFLISSAIKSVFINLSLCQQLKGCNAFLRKGSDLCIYFIRGFRENRKIHSFRPQVLPRGNLKWILNIGAVLRPFARPLL